MAAKKKNARAKTAAKKKSAAPKKKSAASKKKSTAPKEKSAASKSKSAAPKKKSAAPKKKSPASRTASAASTGKGRAAAATPGKKRPPAEARKKRPRTQIPSEERAPVRFDARGLGPTLDNGRRQVGCLTCGLCCTYVTAEAEAPTTVRKATELLWNLYHDRVSIHYDGEDWLVQFETRCQHLQADNKCRIYEKRPHVCREHDELQCEVNHELEGTTFYTPGEFIAFLQRRRKRVFADLVEQGFLPPESTWDGRPADPRKLPAFEPRFRKLRVLGAAER